MIQSIACDCKWHDLSPLQVQPSTQPEGSQSAIWKRCRAIKILELFFGILIVWALSKTNQQMTILSIVRSCKWNDLSPLQNRSPLWPEGSQGAIWQCHGIGCRAVKSALGKTYNIPRSQINLSKPLWSTVTNTTLSPPIHPYTSSLNFLMPTYSIPYDGLLGYFGFSQLLHWPAAKL